MATTYLLDDLCQVYLPAQAGLSLVFGTTLFAGIIPDGTGVADNISAVNEYPGEPPHYTMGPNPLPAITIPHIQVISRNTSYTAARNKCEDIVRALEKITNTTVNTTYYERIERLQDPFPLHRDENRRTIFACNMKVMRTPS